MLRKWLFYLRTAALYVLVLSSCAAHKQAKRDRICATCTFFDESKTVVKHDTITVTATFKDTLYYESENPCADLCDSFGRLKPFLRDLTSDKGNRVRIYTKGNKLAISDNLNGVTKKVEVPVESKETTNIKSVPAHCDLTHRTKWNDFFIISGQIAWGLLLIFLAYKGIKTAI